MHITTYVLNILVVMRCKEDRKMKRLKIFSGLILFTVVSMGLVYYNQMYYEKVVTTLSFPNFNKVVIIDAGHGGIDPGKEGSQGVHEKDLNLKIAQKLRTYIEESGGVAILTRSEDVGLYTENSDSITEKKNEDLRKRRKLIQESNGDLFVSIHLNSYPSSKYYGAQTFYLEGDQQSKILAEFVQNELISVLNHGNDRQAKASDSYYILKENPVPSILVEGGFLSNPEEERRLNDDNYQNKLAWAIYTGIMNYFSYEAK